MAACQSDVRMAVLPKQVTFDPLSGRSNQRRERPLPGAPRYPPNGPFPISARRRGTVAMDHDHSYKLLFSHPEMVADLIRGFVREDWVEHLDFSSLEKVSGTYVADAMATNWWR